MSKIIDPLKQEEEEGTAEFSVFTCADCGGEKFKLYLGRLTDENGEYTDTTLLMVCCGDEKCVEATKKKLGVNEENETITWRIFDITGQVDGLFGDGNDDSGDVMLPTLGSSWVPDEPDDDNNLN